MKQKICLAIIFSLLLCLCACKTNKATFIEPVNVYYRTSEINYNSSYGLIQPELREFYGFADNLRNFINNCMSGPLSSDLVSPFPTGAWILNLENDGQQINVLLSTHFSRLPSYELTLACACISMTLMDLTGVETVHYSIDSANNDASLITMTKDGLVFMNAALSD